MPLRCQTARAPEPARWVPFRPFVPVNFKLSSLLPAKASTWTSFDAGESGELLAVGVQTRAGEKPRVLHASHTASGGWASTGVTALRAALPGAPGRTVAVLDRGDYQIMVLQRPPVPAAEMARSLRWSVASQVDFPVDDAVIVTMVVPAGAGAGDGAASVSPATAEHKLYVVAAQPKPLQAVTQAFKASGQRLDAIDVRETAQRNIAALLEQADECLCLLRVTQQGLQLTFTHRGELCFDRFIAQPLATLQAADAPERARITERLGQQALLSMAHIREHHPQMAVKRVLLCPLPPGLDLESALRDQIGLPLDLFDLADVMDLSAVPQLATAEAQARFFTALGAALRGPA